jgi:hypothetical protein
VTDLDLARSVAVVMGVSLSHARAAVRELQAERHRQRGIAAGLERFSGGPMRLVCDQDTGSGSEVTPAIAAAVLLCQRCGHLLPVAAFALNRTSRTGRSGWCKLCMRDYRQARKGQPLDRARPRLTAEQREKALVMLDAGAKYEKIAAVAGVSAGSVSRISHGL